MSNSSKTKRKRSLWDIHSHVLPGIDDGSCDWETSLRMMKMSANAGVGTIVATPHCLPWAKPVHPDTVRELCQEAADRFFEMTQSPMKVLPGMECYYHSDLLRQLDQGRALTVNDSGAVLVEFATGIGYTEMSRGVAELTAGGYKVVVAHIERYDCLREKRDGVEGLLNCGAYLQSNISDFQGSFFDPTARWLKKQYNRELISFTASDMHDTDHRRPISVKDVEALKKMVGGDYCYNLLEGNARELFQG